MWRASYEIHCVGLCHCEGLIRERLFHNKLEIVHVGICMNVSTYVCMFICLFVCCVYDYVCVVVLSLSLCVCVCVFVPVRLCVCVCCLKR